MSFITTLLAQATPHDLGGNIGGLGRFLPSETGEDAGTQIQDIFTTLLGFLTIVGGLSFLIYFVIGGITWITAGGDQQKIDAAKNKMTGAAIGMVVIIAAYSITWIVGAVLGFDILNPAETIGNIFSGDGGGGGGGPAPEEF